MSRSLPDRRRLISRLFRAISWHGAGFVATGAVCIGYAMAAMAMTGAVERFATGAVPPESIQYIQSTLWFGGALLILAGVAAASVKIFVIPAIESHFAAHIKDTDAHPTYLKMTDWAKSHSDLLASINEVGLKVAGIGGQLRQDIRTDRKADAKAEGNS